MWPFKRKVGIEGFCQEFYNSHVFRPMVGLKGDPIVIWDGALKAIEEGDSSIAATAESDFLLELNSARMECFGLAWVHRLKEEEPILREVYFTKRYLESMQRPDLWEAMADYNRAALASADESVVQARAELTARWVREGVQPDLAERAANRQGTVDSWNSGATASTLTHTFMRRLECQLNSEGETTLQSIVGQLYVEADSEIRAVRVEPSIDL